MTDNQLDQLFKKGLEQEQVFSNSNEQWNIINKKLKPFDKMPFYTAFLLLVMGGLVLWYSVNQRDQSIHINDNKTAYIYKPITDESFTAPVPTAAKEKNLVNKSKQKKEISHKRLNPKEPALKSSVQKAVLSENFDSTHSSKTKAQNIETQLTPIVQNHHNKLVAPKVEQDNYVPKTMIADLDDANYNINTISYDDFPIAEKKNIKSLKDDFPKTDPSNKFNKIKPKVVNSTYKNFPIEKLNAIRTYLTTNSIVQLLQMEHQNSVLLDAKPNKKWKVLAGLSFDNLLNPLSTANVKDSSSVIRNFGLQYGITNKFTVALHYKFNTVAKKIKLAENKYNLPDLPSMSGSENLRQNVALVYERNLFNLLMGYRVFTKEHLSIEPFIGLQATYLPTHNIKYGVENIYGEQDLSVIVNQKFYGISDILGGVDVSLNITQSLSIVARYEYIMPLNNSYNWNSPHLISAFATLKF